VSPAKVRRARLIEGDVGTHLRRLGVPMAFGFLAVLMFQVVDTFFVGQLGTEPLAAIGFTFPIGLLVMSVALGLGVGTASVLSQCIGAGEGRRATRIATDAIGLAIVVVVPVSVVGYLTIDPLFGAMGASGSVLRMVREYMQVWYAGVGLLFVPIVANAALRATGDTRSPAIVMGISGVLNMVLDPLLIFGLGGFPRLEVRGAAIATVLSWSVTTVAALLLLWRRENLINLRPERPAEVIRSWRALLFVAGPAVGTSVVLPLSGTVLMAIMAHFGDAAVGAYGVGVRVEPIAMSGILALALALPVFVGQNWGAGEFERARTGIALSARFALGWGAAAWIFLLVLRFPLAAAFNDDPEVIDLIARFLLILPVSYGMLGLNLIIASSLNALNRPLHSVALAGMRMFGLTIPLAWLGSRFVGAAGVFYGVAVANVIAGALSWIWFRGFLRAQISSASRSAADVGVVADPEA
jgi:putative MATE family efflux protein